MKSVAEILVEIGAFKINEELTTWASGIESPLYCDNRLILSYPDYWKKVVFEFSELLSPLDYDVIAGVATAGIPHASALAHKLNMPMLYVRSNNKAHGKGNIIEGDIKNFKKAVVVEDLFSTGKSAIDACESLRSFGVNVVAVVSIFSYELSLLKINMKQANLKYKSLVTLDKILQRINLNESQSKLLAQFKEKYVL